MYNNTKTKASEAAITKYDGIQQSIHVCIDHKDEKESCIADMLVFFYCSQKMVKWVDSALHQ